jgi:SAM-dependent methyltransferase
MEQKWKQVYTKTFGGQWYPDEGVVRFTARYLQRRVGIDVWDTKRKVKKVLDAGCGNGRHLVFFAEQGFDVYGIDISEEAVEIAHAWLAKKGLSAQVKVASTTQLPFADQNFDIILSYGVLDHIPFAEAKKAIKEIERVSCQGAYLYVTLRSIEDSEFGRGPDVEKNTFVLQEGYEKGIIQHFFDNKEIGELLKGFRIFDIECYEERFPDVFTVDKSFLQSSKGEKKIIDLAKPINLNLKYSRWHIAAERV